MKLVIAATDGSEGSSRAIDMAADIAKAAHARLQLVTVLGPSSADSSSFKKLAKAEGGTGDALRSLADAILGPARARAHELGVEEITTRDCWNDDPAEAIIDLAAREGADIVVVGRRGRGRLAGLLLGSTSQKLVNLSPCAVVVVP